MSKIGIQSLAFYIPPNRLDFEAKREDWGITEDFQKKKLGVLRVARKDPSQKASDLCLAAFSELQRKTQIDPKEIGLIATVTQNPDRSIPHVSAILHGRLGAGTQCATFDISQGCAGYVYGLSIAIAFMRECGVSKGLLFTADPYSEIVDPNDKDTALLFGDGATVTLLSDQPEWECGKFSFASAGDRCSSLQVNHGSLEMDGLAIFDFAAKEVPIQLEKTLSLNGLRREEVDTFLLHSGSRYVVDTICQRAGIARHLAPFDMEDYGNTVSSTIPIMLEKNSSSLGKTVLLSGFGVGLSVASTVLRKSI